MAADFTRGPVDRPATSEEQLAAQKAALLREREGLVRRGLGDRVAAVDAVLAGIDQALEPETVEQAVVEPGTEKATKTRRVTKPKG